MNVYGPFRITKAFAPLLIESKGRIATTGSLSGFVTWPMGGPYTMSKHAVEAFTDSLAGEMAEKKMLDDDRPLSAVVYKAGHHGAKSSSSAEFLEAVQPQYVIVSAGEGNRYGHPHEEVLQRASDVGAAVSRTDELGTIELISDGQALWWESKQ